MKSTTRAHIVNGLIILCVLYGDFCDLFKKLGAAFNTNKI